MQTRARFTVQTVLSPLIATIVSGCASGMNAADCSTMDWAALGEADGRLGASAKSFTEQSRSCLKHGYVVDAAAYSAGKAKGLQAYCTPEGGFKAGAAAAEYFDVCPPETEQTFLEHYAFGARLAALKRESEKAAAAYEAAVASLDQHHYLLSVAEKRYAKPSISNEDREHERQDIEFRRREIARLETNLPKMLDAVEDSSAALAAFSAELSAKGLLF